MIDLMAGSAIISKASLVMYTCTRSMRTCSPTGRTVLASSSLCFTTPMEPEDFESLRASFTTTLWLGRNAIGVGKTQGDPYIIPIICSTICLPVPSLFSHRNPSSESCTMSISASRSTALRMGAKPPNISRDADGSTFSCNVAIIDAVRPATCSSRKPTCRY